MSCSLQECLHRPPTRPKPLPRVALAIVLACGLLATTSPASAQDWGDDDWDTSDAYGGGTSGYGDSGPSTAWSLRAGLGFTVDPDNFLMNFEVPYRFDRFVSAGPMIQVGLGDDRFLVAPTANLTITIPDMPGDALDRFHPMIFAGIGFAVIENKQRGGSNRDSGFLANTGFGVDYALSPRLSVGSRMIFNFLPGRTLDEAFFYAWEIAGLKVSF